MSKQFQYPFNPIPWSAMPPDGGGDNQRGIRAIDTSQRYIYGTRYITWDGRVFKYANAVAACWSYHGAHAAEAAALSWTSNPLAGDAGDRHVTATVASRTEDDLAGGYFMMHDASATDTSWLFGIVGNDATSGSTTRIYLDGTLPVDSTTSDNQEIFENPYRELNGSSNSTAAWMGVPANTAAATEKFWVQTWGPAYITPTNTTLDDPAANERTVYWTTNSGLCEAAVSGATSESQHAGYILNQGGSGIAGPLIYLMCST